MDILWSVLLRTGQTAIEASSTLVVGFFVAAVMRVMLGAAGTRRLFGGEGLGGLFRAWAIGSLLPVCSFGVIPVAREMRRAGVPSATILAFILAAPQLNPLSFLYGLTLSEPIVIICFVIATMALAIAGGEIWKRLFETPADTLPPGDEPTPAPGLKRLAAVFVAASREAFGPTMLYVLIGVAFTGLLAGLLPHGILGTSMRHDDWRSPSLMALIGLPAYSGVLPGMMRIGLIFEHGNSVGAGFVLFELGVGFNLGLIVWLMVLFGWKRLLAWLAILLVLVLGVAYGMEQPLYFASEEASHTHAFDDWTSPFPFGTGVTAEIVRAKLLQKIEVLEPFALAALAVLLLAGGLLARFDKTGRLERWFATAPPSVDRPKTVWNRDVPGPVLGVVALLGLVVFSVVALYIYYPDQKQAFEEIVRVRADAMSAVRAGKKEEATRQLQLWDLLTRKLQVGVFLRTGKMDPEVGKATEDLRERLEELRDALLADDLVAARDLLVPVEEAYRKCRQHYRDGEQAPPS
ncbi:MAG: permease [Gemmataceae bacterium]